MIREEYLRRLVDAAHVDLYLSATDGARVYWPWRMQPVHEISKRHRNACESYIVDSSFAREDITNRDTLDAAAEINAEAAVLADVYQDCDATVDAILDGLELADDHEYDGQLIVPLQDPHYECYKEIGAGDDLWYAIGGLKDASPTQKLKATRTLRRNAVDGIHIHGLGFGVTDELARAVQNDPHLLDSVDYSTPVQNAMVKSVAAGEERMSVVAARAAASLVEDLRLVSPYAEVDPGVGEQVSLGESVAVPDGGAGR